MTDIFVSYAREDEARVRALVDALEAAGHTVFWDRRIPAGRSWREHIGAALESARCVVAVWSRHSITSAFVAEEADAGAQRSVLLPVLLDAVLPPLGFRGVHAADLSHWNGDRAAPAWRQLLLDLNVMLTGAPASAAGSGEAPPAAPRDRTDPPVVSGRAMPVKRALGLGLLATGGLAWLAWTILLGPDGAPPDRQQATVQAMPLPEVPASAVDSGQPIVLRVIEVWSDRPSTLSLRIGVRNEGKVAAIFEAARRLQLEVAGQPPLRPEDTRPLFETLQPGQSVVFALRYAVPPGSAARLSLRDTAGRAVGEPLSLPPPQ